MIKSYSFLSFLIFMVLIISCNGGLYKMTLYPSKVETKAKGDDDNNTTASCGVIPTPFTCGIDHLHGTACLPKGSIDPAKEPVGVGFGHYYDPGTQPCPCWQWVNCVYRGFVKFDLSQLQNKGVASAVLKWDNNPEIKSDTIAWPQGEDCIKAVAVAETDWNSFSIPGEYLGGNPSSAGSLGQHEVVTATIIDWLNGEMQNNGWFFVGENEKLGEKDNNDCKANLSNIRLELLVNDKK
jgi:hypothetical protein